MQLTTQGRILRDFVMHKRGSKVAYRITLSETIDAVSQFRRWHVRRTTYEVGVTVDSGLSSYERELPARARVDEIYWSLVQNGYQNVESDGYDGCVKVVRNKGDIFSILMNGETPIHNLSKRFTNDNLDGSNNKAFKSTEEAKAWIKEQDFPVTHRVSMGAYGGMVVVSIRPPQEAKSIESVVSEAEEAERAKVESVISEVREKEAILEKEKSMLKAKANEMKKEKAVALAREKAQKAMMELPRRENEELLAKIRPVDSVAASKVIRGTRILDI